mgnify:CR=1 FL=1
MKVAEKIGLLKKKNNVYALEALAKANVYLCNKVASEDAISYIKKYNRRKLISKKSQNYEYFS